MKSYYKHLLMLLKEEMERGNTAASVYNENGTCIRQVNVIAVRAEDGIVIATPHDNPGTTLSYAMGANTLVLPGIPEREETQFYVPFAYERYGHIPVKAKTLEEAIEKGEAVLKGMGLALMDGLSEYLDDSAEIDREGLILDKNHEIVER